MFSSPQWSHLSKFLQLSVCRWTQPAFLFPVEFCQRNKCLVTKITSSSWRQFWLMGRRTRQLPTTKKCHQQGFILFSHLCHLVLVNISQDLSESLLVIFGPDQCASSNHDPTSFPVCLLLYHIKCHMCTCHMSDVILSPILPTNGVQPGRSARLEQVLVQLKKHSVLIHSYGDCHHQSPGS